MNSLMKNSNIRSFINYFLLLVRADCLQNQFYLVFSYSLLHLLTTTTFIFNLFRFITVSLRPYIANPVVLSSLFCLLFYLLRLPSILFLSYSQHHCLYQILILFNMAEVSFFFRFIYFFPDLLPD